MAPKQRGPPGPPPPPGGKNAPGAKAAPKPAVKPAAKPAPGPKKPGTMSRAAMIEKAKAAAEAKKKEDEERQIAEQKRREEQERRRLEIEEQRRRQEELRLQELAEEEEELKRQAEEEQLLLRRNTLMRTLRQNPTTVPPGVIKQLLSMGVTQEQIDEIREPALKAAQERKEQEAARQATKKQEVKVEEELDDWEMEADQMLENGMVDDAAFTEEERKQLELIHKAAPPPPPPVEVKPVETTEELEDDGCGAIDDSLRSPICVVMGHVDVGKTKLLDKIRVSSVQEREAGGITQQIGATYFPTRILYQRIKILQQKPVINVPGLLVIDTPGHEAFTNLRARGSSLCDVAVLVIDIMHGIEQQTIQSIQLLQDRNTPFIIALNKVDRLPQWDPHPGMPFRDSYRQQKRNPQQRFDELLSQVQMKLLEMDIESELYWKNRKAQSVVSIVPTSAISGEGVPDLLAVVLQFSQRSMADRLKLSDNLSCTVLEVKKDEGLGPTVDAILTDGQLERGQTIVMAGTNGPVVSQIRSLLTPQALHELRLKSEYQQHDKVRAAMGIKIAGTGLETVFAGSPLYVASNPEEVEELKGVVQEEVRRILESSTASDGHGVVVCSNSLGALEALLEYLRQPDVKIPVSGVSLGNITRTDVQRAVIQGIYNPIYRCILAFSVKMDESVKRFAQEQGVQIFTAEIIYHLSKLYGDFRTEQLAAERERELAEVVYPARVELVYDQGFDPVFRNSDPLLLGVRLVSGFLSRGMSLSLVRAGRPPLELGTVDSIRLDNTTENLTSYHGSNQMLTLKINNTPSGAFGRSWVKEEARLPSTFIVSTMTRPGIEILKKYRDVLNETEWHLVKTIIDALQIPRK